MAEGTEGEEGEEAEEGEEGEEEASEVVVEEVAAAVAVTMDGIRRATVELWSASSNDSKRSDVHIHRQLQPLSRNVGTL